MAGTTVDTGHSATVAFGTTSFTSDILSIDISGVNRAAIETSHMGTAATTSGGFGSRTFVEDALADPGSMTLELHFDADKTPPVDLATEAITLTWPKFGADATAPIWTFNGFATEYNASAPFDDKMTGSIVIKISGKITQAVAT